MIKFLYCLFWGHDWGVIKENQVRIHFIDINDPSDYHHTETRILLGCDRCKKMKMKTFIIS